MCVCVCVCMYMHMCVFVDCVFGAGFVFFWFEACMYWHECV